mmetsp:Transcript_96717/g.242636  ORF Transcript_96717/g.242636 Transcript_96717/m.242636 type:complete len:97 (+) Transcript_96717:413-703(+)
MHGDRCVLSDGGAARAPRNHACGGDVFAEGGLCFCSGPLSWFANGRHQCQGSVSHFTGPHLTCLDTNSSTCTGAGWAGGALGPDFETIFRKLLEPA